MAELVDLAIELLESILAHLPMNDLLTARTVSKEWHNLIRKSPRLQRNLFLSASDVLALDVPKTTHVLELAELPPINATTRLRAMLSTGRAGPILEGSPLAILPVFSGASGTDPDDDYVAIDYIRKSIEAKGVFPASVRHLFSWDMLTLEVPSMSSLWRRMFVTQPPFTAATLSAVYCDLNDRRYASIHDPTGIRLGTLADALQGLIQSGPDVGNMGVGEVEFHSQ